MNSSRNNLMYLVAIAISLSFASGIEKPSLFAQEQTQVPNANTNAADNWKNFDKSGTFTDEGDKKFEENNFSAAVESYTNALAILQKLRKDSPNWNTTIIGYRISSLNRKIETATRKLQEIQATLKNSQNSKSTNSANQQNEKILAEVAKLRENLSAAEKKIKEYEESSKSIKSTNDKLTETQNQLSLISRERDSIKAELSQQLENAKKQIADLNEKIKQTASQNNTLTKQLADSSSKANSELEQAKKNNENLTKQLADLKEQVVKLSQPDEEKNKLTEQLRSQIADANKKIQEISNQNNSLTLKLTELNNINSQYEETKKRLEIAEKTINENKDNLKNSISASKSDISTAQKTADSFSQEINELKTLVANKDSEIRRISADLAIAKAQNNFQSLNEAKELQKELQNKIVSLQKELNDVKKDTDAAALKKAENTVAEQKKKIEQLTQSVSALTAKEATNSKEFQNKIASLQKALHDAKTSAASTSINSYDVALKIALKKAENTVVEQKKKIEQLTQSVSELTAKEATNAKELQNKIASLQKELSDVKTNTDAAALKKAENTIAEQKKIIDNLNKLSNTTVEKSSDSEFLKKISQLEKELATTKEKLNEVRTDNEKNKLQMANDSEVKRLKEENADSKALNEKVATEHSILEKENKRLKNEVGSLEATVSALLQDKADTDIKVNRMEKELKLFREKNASEIQNDIEKKNKEAIDGLMSELSNAKAKIKQLEDSLAAEHSEFTIFKRNNSQSNEYLQAIFSENQKIRAELNAYRRNDSNAKPEIPITNLPPALLKILSTQTISTQNTAINKENNSQYLNAMELAEKAEKNEEYTQALLQYNKASAALKNTDPNIYIKIAEIHEKLKHTDRAIGAYEAAQKLGADVAEKIEKLKKSN